MIPARRARVDAVKRERVARILRLRDELLAAPPKPVVVAIAKETIDEDESAAAQECRRVFRAYERAIERRKEDEK